MIYRDYLEYGITFHCNLKCSNCAAFSPFLEKEYSNLELFTQDINALSKILHTNTLRFVGGEPTLNPQLIDFVIIAKQSGIADNVGICTNGTNLLSMPEDFFQAVDFIDISVYPETKINYSKIKNFLISKNIKFRLNESTKGEFIKFDSVIEQDDITTQNIFDNCYMAKTCHLFSDGKYYKCGVPLVYDRYFKRISRKTSYNFTEEDGILIHQLNFEEKLREHMESNIPLKSCKFCLGPNSIKEPRFQYTDQEIKLHLKNTI